MFDKIGPGVFITHSQGGPVGWNTLLKTRNIKAIASYEPGGAVPFPEGQLPEEAKFITLSKKMEGIEVPMSVFNIPRSLSSFIMEIIYPRLMSVRSYMNGHAVCT